MIIKKVEVIPYLLDFKFLAGTSRGVLKQKKTCFIKIYTDDGVGVGEAGPLERLSIDDLPDFHLVFEQELKSLVGQSISNIEDVDTISLPQNMPSLRFGVETALRSLLHGKKHLIFDNAFSRSQDSIGINGLIWMGDKEFMFSQIQSKLDQGFACLKMKIGAIDFETELELLAYIRKQFAKDDLVLRVDANGAFSTSNALDKLTRLSQFDLHSIEQPIQQRQWEEMSLLCEKTPIPIALDEELIGVLDEDKDKLLDVIKPQFIILKPTLVGGIKASSEWIEKAEKRNISWWITSALESNIGLNAIAQYTYETGNKMPQGLGTGQLYTNNIDSPLVLDGDRLWYDQNSIWTKI